MIEKIIVSIVILALVTVVYNALYDFVKENDNYRKDK